MSKKSHRITRRFLEGIGAFALAYLTEPYVSVALTYIIPLLPEKYASLLSMVIAPALLAYMKWYRESKKR